MASAPFAFTPGVNRVQAQTIPGGIGSTAQAQGTSTLASNAGSYNGPLASATFLGEPFAVWLGLILTLIILKILTEHPSIKVLGENVNPAHIRIGGYNWVVIGVSAATFFVIFKVLFNKFPVPGVTQFANAM